MNRLNILIGWEFLSKATRPINKSVGCLLAIASSSSSVGKTHPSNIILVDASSTWDDVLPFRSHFKIFPVSYLT